MRDKHLTEAGWKAVSVKHPTVHDNGLLKALNTYEHLGDAGEPDARLRALAQIGDFAAKLRKIAEVAAIHEVAAYLDDVGKENGKARAAVLAEKQAAVKSKVEEQKSNADEKKLSKAIGVELLAGLQKSRTVECAVLVCVASPLYGLMVAQRITSLHKTHLMQFTGSTKFLPLGSCIWDEAKHAYSFIMQGRESGLKQQLEQAIKCFTLTSVKVNVMTRSDYEKSQGADKGGAQAALAPDENDPDAPHPSGLADESESPSTSNKSFALGASVGANGKNNKADVQAVQTALNLRASARLKVDGKYGPATLAAIMAFQKTLGTFKPDGLVQPGRATARALAGEKVAPLPAPPKPMAPPKLGKAMLEKAPAVWHGTRAILDNNIKELKKAVLGHYANDHPDLFKEIDEKLGKLDGVLDKLDTKLADSLAKAHATQDPTARKAELQNSKAILNGYIKYVGSEPLIKHIDSNPFGVATNLGKVLMDSLTHMAQSIG